MNAFGPSRGAALGRSDDFLKLIDGRKGPTTARAHVKQAMFGIEL
jgi:hypothetical protein